MLRLKITLKKSEGRAAVLPFSYGDMLAAAVFKKLQSINYTGTFAVSMLNFDRFEPQNGILHTGNLASFELAMLYNAESIIKILSAFEGYFSIGDGLRKAVYEFEKVQVLPEPNWSEQMEYKCLSPIVIPNPNERGNHDYLLPGDALFEDIFFDKLLATYLHFYGQRINILKTPLKYISNGKVKTKLQDVMMNNSIIQVRGYMQFFKIIAPVELQKILYFNGAGAFQSKGFGCVGLANG